MHCNELYVLIRTDTENCKLLIKDECGTVLFNGNAESKITSLSVPRSTYLTITARQSSDGKRITNFHPYISPCNDCLKSAFYFGKENTQEFYLYDRNYGFPIPKATLTFTN